MSIPDRAKSLQETLVRHRRHLHRHPEPSYCEEKTAAYLAEAMRSLGYEVRERQGGFGLMADLVRDPGQGFVLLRADMDSLPIREESGEPFSSEEEGHAHLCGHDAHCAMVLGAATILAQEETESRSKHPDRVPVGGRDSAGWCRRTDSLRCSREREASVRAARRSSSADRGLFLSPRAHYGGREREVVKVQVILPGFGDFDPVPTSQGRWGVEQNEKDPQGEPQSGTRLSFDGMANASWNEAR